METTERKLKKIIEEIGKKQLERFDEKAAKHNPGSSNDVASDKYDWKDSVLYWKLQTNEHCDKLKDALIMDSITLTNDKKNYGNLRMTIIDLMNVLTAYHHKLELEDQE
jgi:hypothetical protein